MRLTESSILKSVKDRYRVNVSLDSIDYWQGRTKPKTCRFTMTATYLNGIHNDIINCINSGKHITTQLLVNDAKYYDVEKTKIYMLSKRIYKIDRIEYENEDNTLTVHFSSDFLDSKEDAQMIVDVMNEARFRVNLESGSVLGYVYIELTEVYENN